MAERDDVAGGRRGRRRGATSADALDSMKEEAKGAEPDQGAKAETAGAGVQREVGRLAEQMREAAQSLLDEQKERMAAAVHGVADALRRTADALERENNATAAHYAGRAAAQIDRFSETVRDRQFGEMVASAEDLARRQPALFVAGAVAAGFVIGRLLARPARRDYVTGEGFHAGHRHSGEAMAGYGAGSGIGGERL